MLCSTSRPWHFAAGDQSLRLGALILRSSDVCGSARVRERWESSSLSCAVRYSPHCGRLSNCMHLLSVAQLILKQSARPRASMTQQVVCTNVHTVQLAEPKVFRRWVPKVLDILKNSLSSQKQRVDRTGLRLGQQIEGASYLRPLGQATLLNLPKNFEPGGVRSGCCRLNVDTPELLSRLRPRPYAKFPIDRVRLHFRFEGFHTFA